MRFYVWQGELDTLVYPATARYLAEKLPNGVLTLYPGEAHLSTVVNRAEEIVVALIAE
jgi:pimeloyl-ACP methyl ester carboxylesterase